MHMSPSPTYTQRNHQAHGFVPKGDDKAEEFQQHLLHFACGNNMQTKGQKTAPVTLWNCDTTPAKEEVKKLVNLSSKTKPC